MYTTKDIEMKFQDRDLQFSNNRHLKKQNFVKTRQNLVKEDL